MIAALVAYLRADRARRAATRRLHQEVAATARALAALGRASRRART